MHPSARPSTVLALALVTVGAGGCPWIFGCGDTSYEDEAFQGTFDVRADGVVETWDGDVVLDDEGACAALCEVAADAGTVSEVTSCELTVTPIEGDTDAGDTDGDTDAGDTDPQQRVGTVQVDCVASGEWQCIGGRHHADLADRAHGAGPDAVAAWLAREAHGEAGSVVAFRRLAAELRAHGAPAELVARALAAAGDEVRHARDVRALATARGGVPARVRALPPKPRSLRALALENAVEGCVHETFAAARAGWQAGHAPDAASRRVWAQLAADEARHADLAADVHAWALTRLGADDARAVETARREAWAALAAALPVEAPEVTAALGLPDVATSRRLIGALAEGLVAAA